MINWTARTGNSQCLSQMENFWVNLEYYIDWEPHAHVYSFSVSTHLQLTTWYFIHWFLNDSAADIQGCDKVLNQENIFWTKSVKLQLHKIHLIHNYADDLYEVEPEVDFSICIWPEYFCRYWRNLGLRTCTNWVFWKKIFLKEE